MPPDPHGGLVQDVIRNELSVSGRRKEKRRSSRMESRLGQEIDIGNS